MLLIPHPKPSPVPLGSSGGKFKISFVGLRAFLEGHWAKSPAEVPLH